MGLHQLRAREDQGKALSLRAVGMNQLQGSGHSPSAAAQGVLGHHSGT